MGISRGGTRRRTDFTIPAMITGTGTIMRVTGIGALSAGKGGRTGRNIGKGVVMNVICGSRVKAPRTVFGP